METPLLEIVREWALRSVPEIHTSVVYHLWSEPPEVASEIQNHGMMPVGVAAASRLEALAQASARITASRLACVEPGVVLLPSEILAQGLQSLETANAAAARGLPPTLSPLFFRSEVLQGLAEAAGTTLFRQSAEEQHTAVARWLVTGTDPSAPFRTVLIDGLDRGFRLPDFDAYCPDHIRALHLACQSREVNRLQTWHDALNSTATAFQPKPVPRRPRATSTRILLLSRAPSYSGAEECMAALAENLDPERFELTAATGSQDTIFERLTRRCAAVVSLDGALEGSEQRARLAGRSLLEAFSPDILFWNGYVGVPMCEAAAERGVPIVQHVQTHSCELLRPQIELAHSVVAVSDFVSARVLELVPNARLITLHNGIPVDRFAGSLGRDEARRRLGVPAGAFVVCVIGRYSPGKRHDIAMKAILRAVPAVPNIFGLFLGDPYTGPRVYNALRRQLEGRALFVPWAEDTALLLRASDMLLHCATNDAFPTCVLEAMASGVPVVAAESGGVPEQLRDRETGVLVEPENLEAFGAAICSLAEQSNFRERLGATARAEASQRFRADRWAAAFADILDAAKHSSLGRPQDGRA
jgi:glycosyltransferase involved in cell wall biosynthesis